jgi:hypothetical protein
MKTRRFRGNRKNRTYKGGKTFASNKNVQLFYNNTEISCDVCKENNYKETIGTIDKSKVRSGVGQFFFGEAAEILDNTSIIIYTCNTCGLCKIIRNKDPIRIVAKEV